MIVFVGFFIFIGLLDRSLVVVADDDDIGWALQHKNVCFGSAKDQSGEFTMKSAGLLQAFRFEHVRGGSCCNSVEFFRNNFTTVKIVDEEDNRIPVDRPQRAAWRNYKYNAFILRLSNPKYIGKQMLRVWSSKHPQSVIKNNSVACFDVSAKIVPLPEVSLELTTTACDGCSNCTKVEKCSSSIKVNGKEASQREDGLNVLVINPNMMFGKTISFRGSTDVRFEEFFSNIAPYSIYVIVLQNFRASNFTTTWYKHVGLDANVTKSIRTEYVGYKIGIVVGCKDRCVDVVELPYFYFGFGDEYTVMLTLTGKKDVKTEKVASAANDIDVMDTRTAITVFVLTVFFIIGVSVLIIYIFKRRRSGMDRVDNEKRTVDVALIDMQERNRTVNETGSPKTEEYGYSALPDVNTKSVEHIYAYVDPQIVKDLINESKPVVPTTSRQMSTTSRQMSTTSRQMSITSRQMSITSRQMSSDDQQKEQKCAEFVDVEGSSNIYMAPSNLPKCDSPMVPQGTPKGAPSKHAGYEVMTCYRDETCNETCNDVTYEEICAHRKPDGKPDSKPDGKPDSENPDNRIDTSNVSVDSTPDTFNIYENASLVRLNSQQKHDSDLYMNVGAYRTYSNGSQQYVSLSNGNDGNDVVSSVEPLYQRISFSNEIDEVAI